LTTSVALASKGHDGSTSLKSAADSAKAQTTRISAIVDLENSGFDKRQIHNMLKCNNGSFRGQKAVLPNTSKLISLDFSNVWKSRHVCRQAERRYDEGDQIAEQVRDRYQTSYDYTRTEGSDNLCSRLIKLFVFFHFLMERIHEWFSVPRAPVKCIGFDIAAQLVGCETIQMEEVEEFEAKVSSSK
jgi:hypothetical protein